jgi:hypothetical protein
MYKFRVFFFLLQAELEDSLNSAMTEAEKMGYEYHDLKFAQSSASGTGMSAVLVLKDKHATSR